MRDLMAVGLGLGDVGESLVLDLLERGEIS